MSQDTSAQEAKRWKQKYYDHLDLLDQKEGDWQTLESILKKTVLRLSITAEGQHATIDRHLHDIRSAVKKQVNVIQLENILDDISALLLKMGDKQVAVDRKVITMLMQLLEKIDFPGAASKQKNRLIKKLSRSSDKDSDELIDEIRNLLSVSIKQVVDTGYEQTKPGLLKNLFSSNDKTGNKKSNSKDGDATDYNAITEDVSLITSDIRDQPGLSFSAAGSDSMSEKDSKPSAQKILIRLLEQLIVPPDLYEVVEGLKLRIEVESFSTGWKHLLKDIAQLINTLRSLKQEEKQEFETFLQQITDRLKEMDGFLSVENASLVEAAQSGYDFDVVVSAQVQDIHDDMDTADDLNDLKSKVEKRLSVVSDNIKQYRINEHARYASAQQNVEAMQSRLLVLEQESNDLRKLVVEKNREAMFDVLTEIPNRLFYEKKAAEEIARCNRFATPLSMAVWDVDLFKQVNDNYGHTVGDKVLKAIAQLLNERMRETDFIARYGGEEFVMFLPGSDEANALELADALREKIAACKFNHHGDILKITVTCGITSFIEGDSHESMFERADKALYAAKHSGRNKCLTVSSLSDSTTID